MLQTIVRQMAKFLKIHDAITIAGNYLAMVLLFGICAAFSYEVAARYIFNAPTSWANAFVSYFLCASIFLAVPNLTRLNEHVTINILREAMPERLRLGFDTGLRFVAGSICIFAAWFCASESYSQYLGGIETILEWPAPKWMVSGFIPYGFLSSGLYFFRHLWEKPQPSAGEGVVS